MKDQDLVRMANQIADYFAAYGDEEAVEGIANHIAMFWEPRMREQLIAMGPKTEGLKPLAAKALSRVAAV